MTAMNNTINTITAATTTTTTTPVVHHWWNDTESDREFQERERRDEIEFVKKGRKNLYKALCWLLDKKGWYTSGEGHIVGHVDAMYDPSWYEDTKSKIPSPLKVLKDFFGSSNISIVSDDSDFSFIVWADSLPHDEFEELDVLKEEEMAF